MRQGISVHEALECILASSSALEGETVPLSDALGRCLTEDLVASRRLPPLDCSAMDGYAVRRDDLSGATQEAPVELSVAFEVAAGFVATDSIASGQAARIFTGAAVPAGSQAVVRQEDSESKGDCVRIHVCPGPRENIRSAGEDIDVGTCVTANTLASREVGFEVGARWARFEVISLCIRNCSATR